MTVLVAETALWIGLGLTGLLVGIAVVAPFVVAFVVFEGDADDIADVQRFIELTEEARRSVPRDLPLSDGEQAAAIVRFQAKKAEARGALWASRGGRAHA